MLLDVRVEGRLPDAVEVAADYLVSEMLANAAKHAHASTVRIDVTAVTASCGSPSATRASASPIRPAASGGSDRVTASRP